MKLPFKFKLKTKERLYLLAFIFIVISVFYYRKFHHPQSSDISRLRERIEAAYVQKVTLIEDMPDITDSKNSLDKYKEDYKDIFKRIDEEESEIIDLSRETFLVDKITKLAEKNNIEIVYIKSKKPKQKKQQEEGGVYYTDLVIDMHYTSSFSNSTLSSRRVS